VREAAVVGIPDAYRGETVKAVVSLAPGEQATPEELVEFARQRLAAFKCPRTVEIIDDLPKTVSGKILRRELRDSWSDGSV
jgi:long-chain acyl-CoA synthetase